MCNRFFTKSESGTVYLMTSFFLIAITLITFSIWQIVQYKVALVANREQNIRAHFAAKAGIEEGVFELLNKTSWDYTNSNIADRWGKIDEDTFYKSNDLLGYDFFEYPVTIAVKVEALSPAGEFNVFSRATVKKKDDLNSHQVRLKAHVVRSFTGGINVLSLEKL